MLYKIEEVAWKLGNTRFSQLSCLLDLRLSDTFKMCCALGAIRKYTSIIVVVLHLFSISGEGIRVLGHQLIILFFD